ncbi:hypothetical protein T492DRAFT_890331 [Pavlovales sp. CCMP2436]|nr:hypothetical protein T492DRAFT_890331 [Pavlovales sp. CCMP2436]
MDALKAAIERKRKSQQEVADPLRAGGKKWVRRGEIEEREADMYREAQRAKLPEKEPATAAVVEASAVVEPEASGKATASAEGAPAAEPAKPLAVAALPDLVVKKRLRALKEL